MRILFPLLVLACLAVPLASADHLPPPADDAYHTSGAQVEEVQRIVTGGVCVGMTDDTPPMPEIKLDCTRNLLP